MIFTSLPVGFVALHPIVTDELVLYGVLERVAHVQNAGDIGRGHHDYIGFLARGGAGLEETTIVPPFAPVTFNFFGVVMFWDIHGILLVMFVARFR
ncbi:hypothetical protein BMS3Bbin04_00207 [bacterium BMS3Bbin04]|nr:hypothetical protein BMS3Bbin04_00207 [bacterium BMS3Bbin04]